MRPSASSMRGSFGPSRPHTQSRLSSAAPRWPGSPASSSYSSTRPPTTTSYSRCVRGPRSRRGSPVTPSFCSDQTHPRCSTSERRATRHSKIWRAGSTSRCTANPTRRRRFAVTCAASSTRSTSRVPRARPDGSTAISTPRRGSRRRRRQPTNRSTSCASGCGSRFSCRTTTSRPLATPSPRSRHEHCSTGCAPRPTSSTHSVAARR